jgi:hypothetical protein
MFIIHLSPVRSVRFDMIVYYRIIGHVIYPHIFILFRLLFDVMLSWSLESVYKSKSKVKVSDFRKGFKLSFLLTNRVEILNF